MQVILCAVRKLCGCVSIIEKLKASGASEEAISDTQELESPISGSFSSNLSSDENSGGTSSQRPLGVKKSKLKKKREENVLELISTMKEEHRELIDVMQKGSTDMQQNYYVKLLALQNEQKRLEIRRQQMELAKFQDGNKVLYMDLSTIGDPEICQIVQNARAIIMQKEM
ncbi:uncharacterized protein LOC142544286 [Primulina tabacum]|uniref:uncharacterized protein LOC142544286 n=1 Tax=Primulina tabacum TaxID=48773 RepID=UPI003F595E39